MRKSPKTDGGPASTVWAAATGSLCLPGPLGDLCQAPICYLEELVSPLRARIASALGLLALACSSSSKTVATESCSPGEVAPCALASGCAARKACNPDGRTYGPCQCVDGGGGSSGSGAAGRGGTGATSGVGGTGPAGAAGAPPGGTGPSGGSAGGPAGSAGIAGGPGGSAGGPAGGSAGGPPLDAGPGGMAGTGGGGTVDAGMACLRCMAAIQQGVGPNDPRLCVATRNTYNALINCACASSACAPICDCATGNPLDQNCQNCAVASCPNVVTACMNDI